MRKWTIILLTIILLLSGTTIYKSRSHIHKWWKQQVLEFKLQMIKQQFLDLQYKYGPEGAIDA